MRIAVAIVAGLLNCAVFAQGADSEQPSVPPLTLQEVLVSSANFFPAILEAELNRAVVAGEQQIALGKFDVLFDADSYNRASGFYDGQVLTSKVTQPLRPLGAKLFGQYQISDGDFPIYEDGFFTNRGGQAKVGVVMSLLRDRDIDERRFAEQDARLALQQADLDVLLTRIGVQRKAAMAYWKWVAYGQHLQVYRDLLTIAEDRDAGLIKQVASGARARIFLTENQQNIVRRRTFVAAAERDFLRAANDLAFYLRDDQGSPLQPPLNRLPLGVEPVSDGVALTAKALDSMSAMIEQQPEVRRLRTTIRRAANTIALRENALKPQLDLTVELAEGLGGVGEGGVSRDSTDTMIGLNFSVPVQRNAAKAKLQQARDKLDALKVKERQLQEKLALQLNAIVLTLRYAEQLAVLSVQEVEQSSILEQAELTRFRSGASDFFVVNIRERAVANARIKAISAALDTRLAQVDFDTATLNLRSLGIAE
ncbi:MAG: TolC family protein [Pseudomonadota bacterium]